MFAGAKRRSSNVRVMQIFHELKAQFPTIPDHIITSCITSYITSNSPAENIRDIILAAAAREQNQMGRPSIQLETPPFIPTPATTQPEPVELKESVAPNSPGSQGNYERNRGGDMNDSESDINRNLVKKSDVYNENINHNVKPSEIKSDNRVAKRPNTLELKTDHNDVFDKDRRLQLSEKCRDVHKLLNSPVLLDKPPRSPLSAKRFLTKHPCKKDSPTSSPPVKKETASTPTQTTDTLVNNILSPSLNLSFNVNCQMGLVQSPVKSKCTARLDLTPTQPWLNPNSFLNDDTSPRSFTSVNLTLRPPSATPQDPIDITSQNSSLTYSTSSFDRQKGLQSRLQITVGPGNAGSVSSVRARPRSFHIEDSPVETALVRTGSLNNLATTSSEPPVLLKQQARIDRMRIELRSGNARLVIMRQEVTDLEKKNRQIVERRTAAEVEKQIRMEIKHLTFQCEQLADLLDKDEFYNSIYTGPTGPLLATQPPRSIPRPQVIRRQTRGRLFYQSSPFELPELEGPKWNCSLCTFLNHPDLDKCEQCEMPRVLHVSAAPGDNIHIHVTPRLSRRIAHSWVL